MKKQIILILFLANYVLLVSCKKADRKIEVDQYFFNRGYSQLIIEPGNVFRYYEFYRVSPNAHNPKEGEMIRDSDFGFANNIIAKGKYKIENDNIILMPLSYESKYFVRNFDKQKNYLEINLDKILNPNEKATSAEIKVIEN